MASSVQRIAALVASFLGTLVNSVLASQLLTLWHAYKWEAESSEWEWLGDKWRVLGIKVVWVLLSTYFASAAAVSFFGLVGVIKNKPSLVRFYRDYYIADFSFSTLFAVAVVYAAFHQTARTGVCEEFSRHPEIMRDVQEMGMNVENCELWFSRAALALAALLFTIVVIRFHFLVSISNYHSSLSRCCRTCCTAMSHSRTRSRSASRRIYLLPASPGDASAFEEGMELVYAPVPVNELPPNVQSQAREAWVSETLPPIADQRVQPRKHHHSRRQSRSSTTTGSIFLPVQPGEGLFSADLKA